MGEIQDAKIPKAYRLTVRRRQAMLEYTDLHGVRATARHFDLDRKTVRAWGTRRRAVGVAGLVPRAPARQPRRVSAAHVALVAHARRTLQAGATRTPVWLFLVHPGRLAQSTIQRLCRDIGLPRLRRPKKRAPKQLILFEKPDPGERLQVDTTVVTSSGEKGSQDTALDDGTRTRLIGLDQRLHVCSSLLFLSEACRAFPFPIRTLQCDNSAEFPFALSLAVQERGIRHHDLRPRRPQQNGKVERSHRVDQEAVWRRHGLPDFDTAAAALPH